jgi:cytochrome c biogenesis protein ResB
VEEVVDYTVLQVTKNPGIPVIYAGFGLMLMGIFISFYMRNPAPSTKPGVSL